MIGEMFKPQDLVSGPIPAAYDDVIAQEMSRKRATYSTVHLEKENFRCKQSGIHNFFFQEAQVTGSHQQYPTLRNNRYVREASNDNIQYLT